MASIVTAVFKATLGLLVTKGRDLASEKLKEGDVTDEQFRNLIVREIDDIKSKLDGLARKDLLASISFLKEGIVILYDVFEKANLGENFAIRARATAEITDDEILDVTLQSSSAGVNTVTLAEGVKNLKVSDLDESVKEALSGARRRFEDARRKATEAFSNEALNTSDRILAMVVRVMGTILEKVEDPVNALAACRVCLEELHALPAVQKSFKVELMGGLKSWFNKDERKEIVTAVCLINHVIYDITQLAGSCNLLRKGLLIWPWIDVGEEKIDPLRDARVAEIKAQVQLNVGCYSVLWSFGQEGTGRRKLQSINGVCTNGKEQFTVGENGVYGICSLRVFDKKGKFLRRVSCPAKVRCIHDIATDQQDNTYVLVSLHTKDSPVVYERERMVWVYVFDKDNNFRNNFVLGITGFGPTALTIEESSKKFFVLGSHKKYWEDSSGERLSKEGPVVEVYDTDGTFCHFFGDPMWKEPQDIAATNDGRIMVLDYDHVDVFTSQRDQLYNFTVAVKRNRSMQTFAETLHCTNDYVIIVLHDLITICKFLVSVHTKNGELLYTVHLNLPNANVSGVTVSAEGRIALSVNHIDSDGGSVQGEILVI